MPMNQYLASAMRRHILQKHHKAIAPTGPHGFMLRPGLWRTQQRCKRGRKSEASRKKTVRKMFAAMFAIGAPYRSRTCGLKIRSLALYPAELRARAKRSNNGFACERKAAYVILCNMLLL